MRFELVDEISEAPIMTFEPAPPCEIGPGHVRIAVGGFSRFITAAECVELGRVALNVGAIAHGAAKVPA